MMQKKNLAAILIASIPLFTGFASYANQNPTIYWGESFVYQETESIAMMREQWKKFLLGEWRVDTDVQKKISDINNSAYKMQESINPDSKRENCLWNDLCDWTKSSTITNNYKRVQEMTLGYSTYGTKKYKDPSLLKDILSALSWLSENHYNSNALRFSNWWHWDIGSPQIIGNILVILYDEIPTQLRDDYVTAMDYFNPGPTEYGQAWPGTNPATGANLLDKVLVHVLSGVLSNDYRKISLARNAMKSVYAEVTSDDGFYRDGSFIQHHYVPYMGGYGTVLFEAIAKLMFLTKDTPWRFSENETQTIFHWINNSVAPLIYKGRMMDATRGRKISRFNETDHLTGRKMSSYLLNIADGSDPITRGKIKSIVKGWMLSDYNLMNPSDNYMHSSYLSNLSLFDLNKVKDLLSDDSISSTELTKFSHIYASMARAVHVTPSFGFSLSMFSDRISSMSYGNDENKKGWLVGAGVTAIYTDDKYQFSDNFWATIDYKRLPGATVDSSDFGVPTPWAFYGNAPGNLRWTGGSSLLNSYSTAGMEFDMSGFLSRENAHGAKIRSSPSNLRGRKSWFMMADRVVAIGSGISNNIGKKVETIVDNRRLVTPDESSVRGDNTLTINNENYTKASIGAGIQSVENVNWAHIQGSARNTCSPDLNSSCQNGSKGVGYLFTTPIILDVLRETRTSSWSEVGTGSSVPVHDNYLSLAINHGTDPTSANYSYVLFPNKSAEEMNAIASEMNISILSHSNDVHAVLYTPFVNNVTRIVGANFWSRTGGTVSIEGNWFLKSSDKSSITLSENAHSIELAVSDPTEKNTGDIVVEINRSASNVTLQDSSIKIVRLSPTIKFKVDVNAAHGRSIGVNFGVGE